MSDTVPIVFHSFENNHGIVHPVKSTSASDGASYTNFRRSHKKSRGGCTRCKTRRIKCDETKPSCLRCQRRGFTCVFSPSPPVKSDSDEQSSDLSPSQSPLAYPSMISETFTMNDMRLFYHFLMKSKPHLPVGNDEVWTHEVPQYAFHNKYLMQSLLASAASHLGQATCDKSLQLQALIYRSQGLEGLRKAILVSEWKEGHADSLIAATTSLLVQSAHFNDGVNEWLTLIKLQQSIMAKVRDSNDTIPLTFDISPERHMRSIEPYLPLLPCVQPELISLGLDSLRKFKSVLSDPDDLGFYEAVHDAFKAHQHSPQVGYLAFGLVFKFMYDLPTSNYYKLISQDNATSQVLLAHFLCALIMMMPLGMIENHKNVEWSSRTHIRGFLGWLRSIFDVVPEDLQGHLSYPRAIHATALAEVERRPFAGPPVMQFDVAVELARQVKELNLEDPTNTSNRTG